MMSAKLANLGLLKINIFWNKGYDVMIFVHDVSNKILSYDSNYIAHGVMWPKFSDSSISMKEVIVKRYLWGFDQKKYFFEKCAWFKFNNLGPALDMALEFYTSMKKVLKLKVETFLGLAPTFAEVLGGKLATPILNRVNKQIWITNMNHILFK